MEDVLDAEADVHAVGLGMAGPFTPFFGAHPFVSEARTVGVPVANPLPRPPPSRHAGCAYGGVALSPCPYTDGRLERVSLPLGSPGGAGAAQLELDLDAPLIPSRILVRDLAIATPRSRPRNGDVPGPSASRGRWWSRARRTAAPGARWAASRRSLKTRRTLCTGRVSTSTGRSTREAGRSAGCGCASTRRRTEVSPSTPASPSRSSARCRCIERTPAPYAPKPWSSLSTLLTHRVTRRMSSRTSAVITTKRTYEPPASDDGRRILVERLWPRGMRKEALEADAWMKEVAPTTQPAPVVRPRGGALGGVSPALPEGAGLESLRLGAHPRSRHARHGDAALQRARHAAQRCHRLARLSHRAAGRAAPAPNACRDAT